MIKEALPMLSKLFKTDADWAFTILRVVLGIVFFAHGAQKMLGWFGGYGFSGTMGFFTKTMGIPAPLAFLAICAQFFGGLGLILGLLSRIERAHPAGRGPHASVLTFKTLVFSRGSAQVRNADPTAHPQVLGESFCASSSLFAAPGASFNFSL